VVQARHVLAALVAGATFFAAGATILFQMRPAATTVRSAGIGGPFKLTTDHGRSVNDQDFRGKWLLIYFGYTHCPDICPTTLAEIMQTLDLLQASAAEVQPLFITIDPDRDTPGVMEAYVKSFDTRLIGLTGTPSEIAAAAKSFKVYYAKLESKTKDKQSYLMEHSSFVYVVGPDGHYVTLFAPTGGQVPQQMALRLRELIAQRRGDQAPQP
jgi:protein SCO1/2